MITHTDTKDRFIAPPVGMNELADLHCGGPAIHRITWTVGEEESIKFRHEGSGERRVPRKQGNACSALDEGSSDVGLCSKIKESNSNLQRVTRMVVEDGDGICGGLGDKILLCWVPIFFKGGGKLVSVTYSNFT